MSQLFAVEVRGRIVGHMHLTDVEACDLLRKGSIRVVAGSSASRYHADEHSILLGLSRRESFVGERYHCRPCLVCQAADKDSLRHIDGFYDVEGKQELLEAEQDLAMIARRVASLQEIIAYANTKQLSEEAERELASLRNHLAAEERSQIEADMYVQCLGVLMDYQRARRRHLLGWISEL